MLVWWSHIDIWSLFDSQSILMKSSKFPWTAFLIACLRAHKPIPYYELEGYARAKFYKRE
jgi:hypothetical protein